MIIKAYKRSLRPAVLINRHLEIIMSGHGKQSILLHQSFLSYLKAGVCIGRGLQQIGIQTSYMFIYKQISVSIPAHFSSNVPYIRLNISNPRSSKKIKCQAGQKLTESSCKQIRLGTNKQGAYTIYLFSRSSSISSLVYWCALITVPMCLQSTFFACLQHSYLYA